MKAFPLVLCLLAMPVAAQQVKVWNPAPAQDGSTPKDSVNADDKDQRILFIPVVTQDTAWDPNNNAVPPALLTDLTNKAADVNAFWSENSYGRVSFQVEVAPRVYQMPRGKDFYFNPGYVAPWIVGTEIRGPSVTVPAGDLRLTLNVNAADVTPIKVTFNAGDPALTYATLQTKVCGAITASVGDKVDCQLIDQGSDKWHWQMIVDKSFVTAGTFLHVDVASSSSAVLDALGLDRPIEDLTAPDVGLESRGAEFPLTSKASLFRIIVTNDAGTTEFFDWNFPAQTFNTADDLIAVMGAAAPNATITKVGNELRFTVTPTIPGPYVSLVAGGPDDLVDWLGVPKVQEADGVIEEPAANTVKGDRNGIAGQAIAAMVLNELTRTHTDPGADPWPNMDIIAANDADIDKLVKDKVDPNRAIVVIFLDEPVNQRAGAAGGYIDPAIENGAYTWHYQLVANVQIFYDSTVTATIAHELGHNIGFIDLYDNSTEVLPEYEFPNDWDVMSAHWLLPHTGFWHKELIGKWLTNSGSVTDTFPEPVGPPETRRYVLTPLEFGPAQYDDTLAGVPADRTKVKAITLLLGVGPLSVHHFLAIENRQQGATFSQSLPIKLGAPSGGGIYVGDSISHQNWVGNLFNPTTRNIVHPLTDVALLAGDNVSPVRDSAPAADINLLSTFPAYDGIKIDIVGELPGPGGFNTRPSYLLDITREQKNFLDLAITPWGAPPYESPDIWIEHADGSLSATPLAGNGEPTRWSATYDPAANGGNPLNWIRVKVSNIGTVDATAVQVRVKVNQPGGMGDTGTWVAAAVGRAGHRRRTVEDLQSALDAESRRAHLRPGGGRRVGQHPRRPRSPQPADAGERQRLPSHVVEPLVAGADPLRHRQQPQHADRRRRHHAGPAARLPRRVRAVVPHDSGEDEGARQWNAHARRRRDSDADRGEAAAAEARHVPHHREPHQR